MKEKYLEYLYDKVINENVFVNNNYQTQYSYLTPSKKIETDNKDSIEQLQKTFNFDYSPKNESILKNLKNKMLDEIEKMKSDDVDIDNFLNGKTYLYEINGAKRAFYFVNNRKIYAGKFIDIPNGENDMYEIVFSEMKKLKTQDLKETEKLNLGISNVKVLSKIYLIIVTCPYFKRENSSVFYFSTIENNNFKSSFKDKGQAEDNIEMYINDCENKVKNEIKDFTELVHENDINDMFKKLRSSMSDIVKTAKIKNKIYENFMSSVESNLGVKLNKYTFNYRKRDRIKVCVAFSKNKSVDDIKKTIDSASHKFKN
jgi:hypothetical protein